MRGWWREIAGLVLPVACGGCGRPRTPLCEECGRLLYGAVPRRVSPDPVPAGLPPVYAVAPYADAVRSVLLAHKERGALGLAGVLGVALAGAVRAADSGAGADEGADEGVVQDRGSGAGCGGALLLVPVPSARRATRARGHDPVRRVAVAAAGELRRRGVRARVLPVLRQRRRVADQAGLGARQRRENLSGALEAVGGAGRLLSGGRTVLVDDLMTTGASLAEAARAVGAARTPGAARWQFPANGRPCAAVIAASPLSFGINRN
ncbi:ComF family protein [Streptomyces sp. NPDC050504]|uniref:ComF family protein n=1 Tax=Streptomyces sp. NPDC050504 TaxID=3365618 RepID=UPI0037A40C9F